MLTYNKPYNDVKQHIIVYGHEKSSLTRFIIEAFNIENCCLYYHPIALKTTSFWVDGNGEQQSR